MSEFEPTKPYISQHRGEFPSNDYVRAGRIWKVVVPGGPPSAHIEGLTRWEAEKIEDALNSNNLRARIAELEAEKECSRCENCVTLAAENIRLRDRLAAAEKVIEAAEWVRPYHGDPTCECSPCEYWRDLQEALAAYREKYE